MKVSKKMLNEELRGKYWSLKILAFMLSKVWVLRLISKSSAKDKGITINDLHCEEKYIPSLNGDPDIRIRIFKPLNSIGELPGMLYIHGGGYVIGTPELFLDPIKRFIHAKACVIIAPDYRKAVDDPYPAAFNDCYSTLLWLKNNAKELGIIPDKFIVGGHSAGGGLAAAVSLKATDTKDVDIAFQMPIYPMIDDRQTTLSALDSNAPGWNSKSNNLAWQLYLRDLKKRNMDIPAYAAPARALDYSKLPPTITFVGDLEPFRDEVIEYVENLKKSAVPVAFKMYMGCFHGFDDVVPNAAICKDAQSFLLNTYSDFVDKYFLQGK